MMGRKPQTKKTKYSKHIATHLIKSTTSITSILTRAGAKVFNVYGVFLGGDLYLIVMEPEIVYLDYNATTPLAPEVLQSINVALRDFWGNPSSSHDAGWS